MPNALFHARRLALSYYFECMLHVVGWTKRIGQEAPDDTPPAADPQTPEDFRPLSRANFEDPYAYYRMLRDDYPVYYMESTGFYVVSRYEDVVALAQDTDRLSSRLTEILATGRPKDPDDPNPSRIEQFGAWGVVPEDVLAVQDAPDHPQERKEVARVGFNAAFVKAARPDMEALCAELLDGCMAGERTEFMHEFAWKFPMLVVMRLLGFPDEDYPKIKAWCLDSVNILSATQTLSESYAMAATQLQFTRYVWRVYESRRAHPQDDLMSMLAAVAADPDQFMTDQRVVAAIVQILIAGSDSSASSMGSAVRKLAECPELQQQLRENPDRIPDFVEELFRTEAAFQGHFRLTKEEMTLHGVTIPRTSRVFLLWGSANRDERFWDDPDTFNMDRKNLKRHLTFGTGVHACIGRDLARTEINIAVRQLLARTEQITLAGETSYAASIFTRSLEKLPISFAQSKRVVPAELQPA